jgi:hypothetical protein
VIVHVVRDYKAGLDVSHYSVMQSDANQAKPFGSFSISELLGSLAPFAVRFYFPYTAAKVLNPYVDTGALPAALQKPPRGDGKDGARNLARVQPSDPLGTLLPDAFPGEARVLRVTLYDPAAVQQYVASELDRRGDDDHEDEDAARKRILKALDDDREVLRVDAYPPADLTLFVSNFAGEVVSPQEVEQERRRQEEESRKKLEEERIQKRAFQRKRVNGWHLQTQTEIRGEVLPCQANKHWVMVSDLEPCTEFFVRLLPATIPTISDLLEQCGDLLGVTQASVADVVRDAVIRTEGTPGWLSVGRLMLVTGAGSDDTLFLQDCFAPGYAFDESKLAQAPFWCEHKRKDLLARFVDGCLKQRVAALDGPVPADDDENGVNYGGNFLVSPPVAQAMEGRLEEDDAGPAMLRQDAAPLGKILVGDAASPHNRGMLGDNTRKFLARVRTLQPLVPIDTSWLHVMHVDEIASFAPDGRTILLASPALALFLLDAVSGQGARLTEEAPAAVAALRALRPDWTYEQLLKAREENVPVQARLEAIARRLALSFPGMQIIPIPVLFTGFESKKQSVLPNLVNVQVVNGRVLAPRPYGPPVPASPAREALAAARDRFLSGTSIAAAPVDEPTWVPRLWVEEKDRRRVPAGEVERSEKLLASGTPAEWHRLRLGDAEGYVDLFEAYVAWAAGALGLDLRFVDDQAYHRAVGDLHCATNALRSLPPGWDALVPRRLGELGLLG